MIPQIPYLYKFTNFEINFYAQSNGRFICCADSKSNINSNIRSSKSVRIGNENATPHSKQIFSQSETMSMCLQVSYQRQNKLKRRANSLRARKCLFNLIYNEQVKRSRQNRSSRLLGSLFAEFQWNACKYSLNNLPRKKWAINMKQKTHSLGAIKYDKFQQTANYISSRLRLYFLVQ